MFAKLQNSWELMRSAYHVLAQDKELLIFPILSGAVSLVALGSFLGGAYATGVLADVRRTMGEQRLDSWPAIGLAFAFYFVSYLVVIYFNSALIGAAYIRLQGGNPTIGDGFAAANRCLGSIVGYALMAATVGLLLRLIEQRSQWVARLAAAVFGMAWSLVTYLVVPVMVIERATAPRAVARSANLFRRTWGEQVVGSVSFGLVGLVLFLPALLVFFVAVAFTVLGAASWPSFPIVLLALALVVYLLAVSVLLSALQGIYNAALYAFAIQQTIQGFPRESLASAFSPRGS